MDEYISREALLAEIAADYGNWIAYNDTDESYRQGVKDNYSDTIRLINDIPAADVQPVKQGRWILCDDGYVRCSKCNRKAFIENDETILTDFYHGCGARMDGDSE